MVLLYVPGEPVHDAIAFRLIKRCFDIVVATGALILFGPLMFVLSVMIKAQDGGPVFYRQTRIGRYGVPFDFYKFRSMHVNADEIRKKLLHLSDAKGAAFKMKDDPRVTKLGKIMRKYSLDELPQLFSVLGGHMSIIGPRPHLGSEVKTYSPPQLRRLLVRPGLICTREISGRSKLSFEEWLDLDLKYVEERSIMLDAKIFLMAIPAVLKADGAY